MQLTKATFTTYPFIFELLPEDSLREALIDFLQRSSWIDVDAQSLNTMQSIAQHIDDSDIEFIDTENGEAFEKGDAGHPTLFHFESKYLPIKIHLCSYSHISGEDIADDRALLIVRVGREYRQLYSNIPQSIDFYRALCDSFNPRFFSSMYGGPAATIARYFLGHRNSLLHYVDNCSVRDLLPPVGVIPKALLVEDYESVALSANLRACWPVNESHVFVDTWPKWYGAVESEYKQLAQDFGLKYTFYDIPNSE